MHAHDLMIILISFGVAFVLVLNKQLVEKILARLTLILKIIVKQR